MKIAFFARGRGKGHAVPDIAIVEGLQKLEADLNVTWVSYGTGAATLRESGRKVEDLGLPDENPFLETQLRCIRSLAKIQPSLVVSHEEFAAAPASALFGFPSIFLTDYFLAPAHLWMQCLSYATEIIFADEPGLFPVPKFLEAKTSYTKPMIRPLRYARHDRERARSELLLKTDTKLLLVLPGGWFTERKAPIFELVLAAFKMLPAENKLLVWMAGEDFDTLTYLSRDQPRVLIKRRDPGGERWMVACDCAITKATRKTSLELAALGVPSISLSHNLNPIDDARVSRLPNNVHFLAKQTSAEILYARIVSVLDRGPTAPSIEHASGIAEIARKISSSLRLR